MHVFSRTMHSQLKIVFLLIMKFLCKFLFSAPTPVEPRCVLGDLTLMIKLFSYLAISSVTLNARFK